MDFLIHSKNVPKMYETYMKQSKTRCGKPPKTGGEYKNILVVNTTVLKVQVAECAKQLKPSLNLSN